VNKSLFARFAVPSIALVGVAALVALFAGISYALMALLLGVVIMGGLAAGTVVATADDAPFETDDSATAAGDTPEHSDVSSAPERSTR
jgi:hypothetical protein